MTILNFTFLRGPLFITVLIIKLTELLLLDCVVSDFSLNTELLLAFLFPIYFFSKKIRTVLMELRRRFWS